jgi:hypothetical protein
MGVDQLVTGGDVDDPVVDSLTSNSVNTEKANITDETLVDVYPSTDQSVPSATWTEVKFDTEDADVLGEFDITNNQFSPASDGYYQILCSVTLDGGASGDQVGLRFQNITDGEAVTVYFATHTGGFVTASSNITRKLFSSKNYEVQIQNYDSSDTINPGSRSGDITFLTVRSAYL